MARVVCSCKLARVWGARYWFAGIGRFHLCHPQQFADFLCLPVKAAIDAKRTQRAIFPAGIDAHGLRRKVQIMRGGSGVYGGSGFRFQRNEALFGLRLHFEAFLRV